MEGGRGARPVAALYACRQWYRTLALPAHPAQVASRVPLRTQLAYSPICYAPRACTRFAGWLHTAPPAQQHTPPSRTAGTARVLLAHARSAPSARSARSAPHVPPRCNAGLPVRAPTGSPVGLPAVGLSVMQHARCLAPVRPCVQAPHAALLDSRLAQPAGAGVLHGGPGVRAGAPGGHGGVPAHRGRGARRADAGERPAAGGGGGHAGGG